MAAPVYLADTTIHALAQHHDAVNLRVVDLLLQGRLAACQMMALEFLNNAPDPLTYEVAWAALHAQRWIDVTTEAMIRAMEVHRELAAHSQHRGFKLPGLIIAATAELAGATVLHYDADYDRIAAVTGQPTEWVVERGSL